MKPGHAQSTRARLFRPGPGGLARQVFGSRRGLVACLAIIALAACGGSPTAPTDGDGDGGGGDDPPPGFNNTTVFRGTIAGSNGRSGIIEITIQAVLSGGAASASRAASVPILALHGEGVDVSGSVTISGPAATSTGLTGHYDQSAGGLLLSGGEFNLQGNLQPDGTLEGTYDDSGNGGGFSMVNSSSAFVTAYCGSFTGVAPDDRGTWNVQLASSGQMSGVAVQDGSNDNPNAPPISPGDPDVIYIRGSLSNFTMNDGTRAIGDGSGSLSGGTVSGNWRDFSGDTGTFSASTVGCQ